MTHNIQELISASSRGPLTEAQAESVFNFIMTGEATLAQMAGILMAMRTRGETIDEITAAATVMRNKCLGIKAPQNAMDIVGTGGDGKGTLNISTATAFVVSGCQIPVAKHGNRNLSSKSGAADVLSELNINVMTGPEVTEKAINQIGIGFMMAPVHHPAMKHVMPVRKELGTRTIFNILGPLTNPAQVKYQLTGAFSRELLIPMAQTLGKLGCERAWVVHGQDGTDEVAITGTTYGVEWANGEIKEFTITPDDAGLPVHPFDSIKGGEPHDNAEAMRKLLAGELSPYRDAVLLNAASALVIVNKAQDLKEGVQMAQTAIDSGTALEKLDALVLATNTHEL